VTYLALVRHGETEWNRIGVFMGWSDEGLAEEGRLDAKAAGAALADVSSRWDIVYVSTLRRSAETAAVALAELRNAPHNYAVDWRINERHVGDLEGVRHADIAAVHGAAQVEQWRWGWDERPPLIGGDDPRQAAHRKRHPELGTSIPRGESLADVVQRVRPWLAEAKEAVGNSRNVVAFTHGTTLRALRVLIEGLAPRDVYRVRAANGSLVVYRNNDGRLAPAVGLPRAKEH
jgi:2,3-bisphosphoglycerate-dependent phosphoglycerate mutase